MSKSTPEMDECSTPRQSNTKIGSCYSNFSSKDLKNVGNYALGKLIGKGSFGKVYLAHHKLTNGSKVRRYVLLFSNFYGHFLTVLGRA